MSDEKTIHVINKRNRAVFAVPLQEAKELIEKFDNLLETQEELPPEPEKTETPDELKILGGRESRKTEEPAAEKAEEKEIAAETQEELPPEPEKATADKAVKK